MVCYRLGFGVLAGEKQEHYGLGCEYDTMSTPRCNSRPVSNNGRALLCANEHVLKSTAEGQQGRVDLLSSTRTSTTADVQQSKG